MALMESHDVTGTQGLAELRRAARAGDAEASRVAAEQFEALFLQMVIKQMRDAMPTESGLFGGEGMKLYESLHDQQLALAMAQRGGIGLTAAIERQLSPQPGRPPDSERRLEFPLHRLPARRSPLVRLDKPADAAAAPRSEPSDRRGTFVRRLWPHARRAAARLGVAPEVLVAQAALETGWGRHVISDAAGRSSHNLFGIKATGGWQGERVRVPTLEYRDGIARREVAAFRGYRDEAASFADYVNLVGSNPRYRQALAADSPEGYLRALQDAGYATDPDYADKILGILARGLPGLDHQDSSSTAVRPITPPAGDPGVARTRLQWAGEENT